MQSEPNATPLHPGSFEVHLFHFINVVMLNLPRAFSTSPKALNSEKPLSVIEEKVCFTGLGK